jgi:DNA-binding response OmpR family regulator
VRGTAVIVEDDEITAQAIALYLGRAGYVTTVAGDGAAALKLVREQSPSVVILDVMLPGLGGIEVCRGIRATSVVPVIMLTARTAGEDVLAGFDAGADDYVGKPFSPAELVARVEAILRRAQTSTRVAIGPLVIDLEEGSARVSGAGLDLTMAELRVLATLAGRPGRIWRREELLLRAGAREETGPRVIDVHVAALRRKLGDPGWIETVRGVGFRLRA